jgi:hypothetical protein
MLERMPASLLAEWMAFDRLEPVSLGYRAEVGSGIVASVIANVNRDPKRRREPYAASDFMPEWCEASQRISDSAEESDPAEVWQKVKAWAERYKN